MGQQLGHRVGVLLFARRAQHGNGHPGLHHEDALFVQHEVPGREPWRDPEALPSLLLLLLQVVKQLHHLLKLHHLRKSNLE